MPENRQFDQRLEAWQAELKNQIMTPLIVVAFSGCSAGGCLSPREAEKLPFAPARPGDRWGDDREYFWFRAEVTLPEGLPGEELVFVSGLGGEQTVYLDGIPIGAVDREHPYVPLHPAARAFTLLAESYAGNGPRLESLGPCPPERVAVPKVTGPQCAVGVSRICLWNEDAYQLYMDADTLIRLWRRLPETSLRREKIRQALLKYIHTADFELPPAERAASFRRAREALSTPLQCRNGSTAPVMHIIGQSHIDLAWLWPMEETGHKVIRTFSTQLSLMDRYPEYRFLACEPALLEMLREREPALFGRVAERVRSGQILPEGAFYAECDTNIPDGESLIRQLLWGKKWFREHFGVESRVAWQPDTFGFSPCLPQLLRAFDIPYFATQKLLRADPESFRFPWQDFIWEGPDGSRVQAVSFFKNNARTDPDSLLDRWEKHRTQAEDISCLLYPFGFGDGGGGATRNELEYLRREKDLEGLPRTEWRSLPEHFEITRESAEKNTWHGELYLPWHRGTYTVQRSTKAALRALERALHDTEFLLASCSHAAAGEARPALESAWKTLLVHQFHDIAAGVGIRDVHREAVRCLEGEAARLREMIPRLAAESCGIAPAGEAPGWYTAVNTLSFDRREWIDLPDGSAGFLDVPSCGTRAFRAEDLQPAPGTVRVEKRPGYDAWHVDNGILSFDLEADGTISSLTDLRLGLPLQENGMRMNDLRLYDNVEPVYDAWELSRDYALDRKDAVTTLSTQVRGAGTGEFTAVIERRIGQSPARQLIRLRAGSDRIEFETDIDWRERHKLLKAHFESGLKCGQAVHGMQFCHVFRPAHRAGPLARDRYEVCQQKYSALFEAARGLILHSQSVWGISCLEGDMALSLLRAPCVPDDTCDRGEHHFSYALTIRDTPFVSSGAVARSYTYEKPLLILPGKGRTGSGYSAEGAVIETVMPSQDGDGVILRLWEYRGTGCRVTLRLPRPARVFACEMDESGPVPVSDQAVTECRLVFRPFGIRTVKVVPVTG
ncbi:MAG: alpha-mannosidase [Clostridia bacterium]|nr:alpha-mannosidase [Clostridia bacterium]